MVLEIKGDIRDTAIKNIAHGVNCQGVMGSGVAKALFDKWPEVREEYIKYHNEVESNIGKIPSFFLGRCQYVHTKDGIFPSKVIINMHTQLNFGPGDKKYVDYSALLECFNNLSDYIRTLAVPRIGAGLAGGDWNIIKKIMVETTQKKNIDLVIYKL